MRSLLLGVSHLVAGIALFFLVPDPTLGFALFLLLSLAVILAFPLVIRQKYTQEVAAIEQQLQKIVEGHVPNFDDASAPWEKISKHIKSITTYMRISQQSLEDRISILEDQNDQLKEERLRTKEALMILDQSTKLQNQMRGLMNLERLMSHAMSTLLAEMSAHQAVFFRLNPDQGTLQARCQFNLNFPEDKDYPAEELLVFFEEQLTLSRVLQEGSDTALSTELNAQQQVLPLPFEHCAMVAPLIIDREIWGVVCMLDKETRGGLDKHFLERDQMLFESLVQSLQKDIKRAYLFDLATVDNLSGLYIRRYFEKRFEEELKRARRYQTPFSLLMMDIDFFERFNQTYGYQQGNRAIAEVSELMLQQIRQDIDVLSRYSGDEFALLLPQTEKEHAVQVAERIRVQIENMRFEGVPDTGEPHLTISIGVSTYPSNGEGVKEILEHADKGLYLAKEKGRNQIAFYTDEERLQVL